MRRCPWPSRCRCNHRECDYGWVAGPTTVQDGLEYPSVKKCPECFPQANEMPTAEEAVEDHMKRAAGDR